MVPLTASLVFLFFFFFLVSTGCVLSLIFFSEEQKFHRFVTSSDANRICAVRATLKLKANKQKLGSKLCNLNLKLF